MRSYERSNVHVDQCSECRGIFLDRGELEHLIDAELKWSAADAAPPAPAPAAVPQQAPPQHYQQPPPQQYQQQYPPQQYGKPYRKRKSFLEELFD
jgi:Zn-finger nucleic acid-binding protein